MAEAVTVRTRRTLAMVAAVCAVVTIAGIITLRPTGRFQATKEFGRLLDARIEAIEQGPCQEGDAADAPPCRFGLVRILQGPDAGQTKRIELPTGEGAIPAAAGDRVVVSFFDNPEAVEAGVQYELADRNRKPVLFWLAVLVAIAVVVLGRLRGLAALAGLAASLVVLVKFVLPAILDGRSPLLVAVVGASAIAFIAIYAAHGFGPKTTVALLGTLASLGIAAALGSVFTALSELSGRASEEAGILSGIGPRVDFVGIFLAGLIIGALGAIDDVTVTQTSAIWEMRAANASMSRRELRRAGMRVGRDHVGSTVNTLALAYAGSSMALLLLFVLTNENLRQVANGEVVAVEVVRTLVGSIALVAAVPITTWLASLAVAPPSDPAQP